MHAHFWTKIYNISQISQDVLDKKKSHPKVQKQAGACWGIPLPSLPLWSRVGIDHLSMISEQKKQDSEHKARFGTPKARFGTPKARFGTPKARFGTK
jgi:hypothetical protein